MSLVEYSDSEDSDSVDVKASLVDNQRERGIKRKRSPDSNLPPLPGNFHDLYASASRVSSQDDPSLHGGRQRITPHIEGKWPSHIYIECTYIYISSHLPAFSNNSLRKRGHPPTEQFNQLNQLVTGVTVIGKTDSLEVHSLLKSDLGADLPLHISLSRPIVLFTDQRQKFVDTLTKSINLSYLTS